ncbi:TPA: PTS fructose transporter subunit IIB [Streptococcus suis]|nr:PTS fructose transporter subunit IIB [Streptococcus suis]HEM4073180.1 PTS fructose transporter subunit IIB [Streptococcus suis]HEM4670997.1 PTS fructose transporter subunit IIB [Streptococcus suis]HEM5992842.1 PTS fructose transporter subunit IIB [Streptococcus suis]HEM6007735.1 PTS fructose transporter subunit IIB [Streptococcus suis]
MSKTVVALCACPMGLAHTFMAAEAIEMEAKERGYQYKVETQGSDGVQNKLTPNEIAAADFIIHAIAVTPLELERFDGYEVYEVGLQEVIKDVKHIFDEIEEDLKI